MTAQTLALYSTIDLDRDAIWENSGNISERGNTKSGDDKLLG
jgi:hypothetical protein